jgi:acid phosphatase
MTLFKHSLKHSISLLAMLTAAPAAFAASAAAKSAAPAGIDAIQTVIVIFAENRSFDNLYGSFPGANGLQNVTHANSIQRDRDGSVLSILPPVPKGLTAPGVTPPVTKADTANLPNKPFAIDDPKGFNTPLSATTTDLWHLFYQNQMQIDGGKNDKFAAWADAGALVMGHYDGSKLPLWSVAKKYVLADNFFMSMFGGSFLNHFGLICACVPVYPNADKSIVAAVNPDGVSLALKPTSPISAIDGIPDFVNMTGQVTPDFYAVNTLQPPYQPSMVPPPPNGDPTLANPSAINRLPPQTETTIGDLLSQKGVSWAWYAGAWQDALDKTDQKYPFSFQTHHQPFNYFVNFAPGTQARNDHLKDGGTNGSEFLKAIDAAALPQVTFYKPQGNLNEHAGYADVLSGDQHIADVVAHLEKSPQWPHMLVVVTYDENGGFWDHVAPPKGDRWGPGSRIPAIIVSPFAKMGTIDHTQYDTFSILRFITERYNLPVLAGITQRDAALRANGQRPMGDLTQALRLAGPTPTHGAGQGRPAHRHAVHGKRRTQATPQYLHY